ncbi:MAG: TerB family tellurite resistance protein [Cytophagaceae bacterium]|nr:TerB family tellurite resistance protein [Cytophagaceae bacterium]
MLTLFETKKNKTQKSHLKNLIALAKADGMISSEELALLHKLGAKNGLKESEVNALIEDAKEFAVEIPSNDSERFDQIFELVQVMMADGGVDDKEMDLCIEAAEKLGFRKAIVGVLVRKIGLGLTTGLEKEAIKSEVESFLAF